MRDENSNFCDGEGSAKQMNDAPKSAMIRISLWVTEEFEVVPRPARARCPRVLTISAAKYNCISGRVVGRYGGTKTKDHYGIYCYLFDRRRGNRARRDILRHRPV